MQVSHINHISLNYNNPEDTNNEEEADPQGGSTHPKPDYTVPQAAPEHHHENTTQTW